MLYSAIFFSLLLLLFLSSRFTSQTLTALFGKIVRSHGVGVRLLAIIFLPGVVLHELSHAIMAMLLFVPVGKMEFMPAIEEDHVKLGSVQIGKTDPVRRMLIGLAPVLVGCMTLLAVLFFFLPRDLAGISANLWQNVLVLYGVFAIGNTMFSSRKDVEGTVGFFGALCVVALALFLAGVRIPEAAIEYLRSDGVQELFRMGSVFLAVPLGINAFIIILARAIFGVR